MEIFFGWITLAIIAWVIFISVSRVRVIFDYERGVKFVRGKYVGTIQPGLHRFNPRTTILSVVDIRPRYEVIAGQEVLTLDGVAVRVSMVATYAITDPHAAMMISDNSQTVIHLEVQNALRNSISSITADDLLEQREEVGKRVEKTASEALAESGLELKSVVVRDLVFPGALKQTFTLVLQARKEAEAALERARGEQAALRSLANTAKQLEQNPNLLKLRLLQTMAESTGNTFVLNMSSDPQFGTLGTGSVKTSDN